MHVQLLDYINEIFSFYNENKKKTSNLSTFFETPTAPNTNRKTYCYKQQYYHITQYLLSNLNIS